MVRRGLSVWMLVLGSVVLWSGGVFAGMVLADGDDDGEVQAAVERKLERANDKIEKLEAELAQQDEPPGVVTGEVDTASKNTNTPPPEDVSVTECRTGLLGPEAVIEIRNNSSERSSYMIEVSFESVDGSRQFGTGIAFVRNLEPGQSATETSLGMGGSVDDGFTCRVVSVDRTGF